MKSGKQDVVRANLNFIKSFAAGVLLTLAAFMWMKGVFSGDQLTKIASAALFSTALCGILILDLRLFTGSIGYLGTGKSSLECLETLFGNIFGALIIGCFLSKALTSDVYQVINFWNNKITDNYSIFTKSVACGSLMFLAVEGWKRDCRFLTIFSVATFLLAGFEHSVANTAFIGLSYKCFKYLNEESAQQVVKLISISYIGNAVGAISLRWLSNQVIKSRPTRETQ